MRGTLWLWLAGTAFVCASLQVSALPYSDSRVIQENSLLSLKRTKPSLSIVNPLDVLRQRIILEMARRQMRENTRQVELNKALLREIGKRSSNFYDGPEDGPLEYGYYDRKPYNHRVAPVEPERGPAEDELDAMVESLLRGSHLMLRDANHHHVRSVNGGQSGAPEPGSQDLAAPFPLAIHSQREVPQQPQPQQLGRLFNNEQDTVVQPKDGAYQEREGGNGEGQQDEDGAASLAGSEGTLKGLSEGGGSFLDVSPADPVGKVESRPSATGNDRNGGTESDFRPRFVYGMYKNRYAN